MVELLMAERFASLGSRAPVRACRESDDNTVSERALAPGTTTSGTTSSFAPARCAPGQLETRMVPCSGRSISRIRNIAPPIAMEPIRKADNTVVLRGH